jgi:RND family efflux transporter MFP subunit
MEVITKDKADSTFATSTANTNSASSANAANAITGAATLGSANEVNGEHYSSAGLNDRAANATIGRRNGGFARLLGVTGILMSVVLPIGIVPRVMQSHELDRVQTRVTELVPQVSVTHPSVAPAQRSFSLPGTIEAIVESPIYARTNGYVQQRFVDIGDRVKAGQLLARIETPEVDLTEKDFKSQVDTSRATKLQSIANRERAQADLDRAIADLAESQAYLVEHQSDVRFAKSTTQRWSQLASQGAVSAQDADEKETRFQTSKAAIDAAREHVNSAQSAVVSAKARLRAEDANVSVASANFESAVARANRSTSEKSFQNVMSPFAGVITERTVDQGNLVTSGSDTSRTPLYKLARIDVVRVYADVPQYASSEIKVGQTVQIALKEFPDRTFSGKVARTSVALDPKARTLRVEIHVPNKDLVLAPGMYADINFSIPRYNKMYLIPANSLIARAEGPQVITVKDGKVSYREVKLGADLGSQIEVVSGLSNQDVIVLNPADTLTEKAAVTIAK